MEADLQSFVTFYLTGRKQAGRLDDMGPLKLRPAALAGYADLTRLRYDFPLVLIDTPSGERFAEPLSRLVDAALDQLASHADAERIRQHAFRLEQRIREKLVAGESGLLSEIWHKAAQELGKKDPLARDSLARLKIHLKPVFILEMVYHLDKRVNIVVVPCYMVSSAEIYNAHLIKILAELHLDLLCGTL